MLRWLREYITIWLPALLWAGLVIAFVLVCLSLSNNLAPADNLNAFASFRTSALEQRVATLERRVTALEGTTTTLPPTTTTVPATTTTEPPPTTTTRPPTTTTTKPPTTTTTASTTTTAPPSTTTTWTLPPTTTTTAPSGQVYTSTQQLRAGGSITDCTIRVGSSTYAIAGSGASNSLVRDVTVEGGKDAIKIGSGSQSVGVTIDGLTALSTSHVAAFFANVSALTARNLTLRGGYALYLERGNHGLNFYNVNLTSTADWAIHAYNWETQNEPSDGILIDGGTVNAAQGGFVLSGGWRDITIRNLSIHVGNGWPAFRMYGGVQNVLIEDCEVWGGSALLDVSHADDPPRNIVMRNVVYHGSRLPGYPWLTLENVRVE